MYATEADLIERFGANAVENLKLMHENPDKAVQVALSDAAEEINGYIGRRYALPIQNVPSNLKRIACDIARYRLYFQQPTEHVENLYNQAISFLKRVQDNKADLQIMDAQSNEVLDDDLKGRPSVAPIGTTYRGGVFGDDTLDKMPTPWS